MTVVLRFLSPQLSHICRGDVLRSHSVASSAETGLAPPALLPLSPSPPGGLTHSDTPPPTVCAAASTSRVHGGDVLRGAIPWPCAHRRFPLIPSPWGFVRSGTPQDLPRGHQRRHALRPCRGLSSAAAPAPPIRSLPRLQRHLLRAVPVRSRRPSRPSRGLVRGDGLRYPPSRSRGFVRSEIPRGHPAAPTDVLRGHVHGGDGRRRSAVAWDRPTLGRVTSAASAPGSHAAPAAIS